MSIAWVNVAALWGLALVAIPIAIHLLVRQQTRTVQYPSLRFVRETALAAFRRRAIEDALLLACRALIVIAAVLALAGPIFQTPSRTAGYAERTSRAVVRIGNVAVDETAVAGAFRTQTFHRPRVVDALGDAARWFDEQPPSLREIVIVGEFRRGQIAPGDLQAVASGIGIRFLRVAPAASVDRFRQRILTRQGDRLVFALRDVGLNAESTQVTHAGTAPAPDDIIRIVAAPADQRLADAALRTALDEGLPWPDEARRIVVSWEGAPAIEGNAEVLRMRVPEPPASAASAVWNAVSAATPLPAMEPVAIPQDDLTAWSRLPQGISPRARPTDEGDRRWFWAAALALLVLEHWLRRNRTAVVDRPEERKVA